MHHVLLGDLNGYSSKDVQDKLAIHSCVYVALSMCVKMVNAIVLIKLQVLKVDGKFVAF